MGNIAGYRKRVDQSAVEYRDKWKKWRDGGSDPAKRPDRNLQMETLAGVARRRDPGPQPLLPRRRDGDDDRLGEGVRLQDHVRSITRVEAYKVRDLLVANNICASLWADWWGFKLEAYDGITREHRAGATRRSGCAIVHSDDPDGIQRLNQEAAKAMRAGLEAGMKIDARRRGQLADDQPGAGARDRQGDRVARAGEERRCGDLVGRSVQRLRQGGAGVHRRRAGLSTAPTSSQRPRRDFELGPGREPAPASEVPVTRAARPPSLARKRPDTSGRPAAAERMGAGPAARRRRPTPSPSPTDGFSRCPGRRSRRGTVVIRGGTDRRRRRRRQPCRPARASSTPAGKIVTPGLHRLRDQHRHRRDPAGGARGRTTRVTTDTGPQRRVQRRRRLQPATRR